jgi:hypothetical protein
MDTKFKTFRIRFIFDFNIIFIDNCLKMVPTHARFSPGFPPGAGIPVEHVFREFSGAPAVIRTTLEQPHLTCADLFRAGFLGEHFLRIAPTAIRATLEQIPLRETLFLEEILG